MSPFWATYAGNGHPGIWQGRFGGLVQCAEGLLRRVVELVDMTLLRGFANPDPLAEAASSAIIAGVRVWVGSVVMEGLMGGLVGDGPFML